MCSFENILCPIDFSKNSLKALEKASELSRVFRSKLTVLHVIETNIDQNSNEASYLDGFDSKIPLHEPVMLKARFEQYLSCIIPSNIDFYSYVTRGNPADEILRLEKLYDIKSIVMGLYGNTKDLGRLYGNVAKRVIEEAQCAVFTILDQEKIPEETDYEKHLITNLPEEYYGSGNPIKVLEKDFNRYFQTRKQG